MVKPVYGFLLLFCLLGMQPCESLLGQVRSDAVAFEIIRHINSDFLISTDDF